jgi:hypothetical protein
VSPSSHFTLKIKQNNCFSLNINSVGIYIVTCGGGVRETKMKGSRSDDWIYWHFGYNLSLNYN